MHIEEQRTELLIRHLIYPHGVLDETGGIPDKVIPSKDLLQKGWSVDRLPPFTVDEFQVKKGILLAGNTAKSYDGALEIALTLLEQLKDQQTGQSLFEIIHDPTEMNPSHANVFLVNKQTCPSRVKQAREKIKEVAITPKHSEEELVVLIGQHN